MNKWTVVGQQKDSIKTKAVLGQRSMISMITRNFGQLGQLGVI